MLLCVDFNIVDSLQIEDTMMNPVHPRAVGGKQIDRVILRRLNRE